MVDAERSQKEARDRFVEDRSNNEREINHFLTEIAKVDKKYLEGITPLSGATTREVVPSMWIEPFDKEAYDAQIAVVKAYIIAVKKRAEAVNEEAERCFQQSRARS